MLNHAKKHAKPYVLIFFSTKDKLSYCDIIFNNCSGKPMNLDSKHFDINSANFLEEFAKFISFPSISADSDHLQDCENCAHFLVDHVNKIFDVELWETPGHPPIIYASYKSEDPLSPTLMLYNHYDVQPAQLSDGWKGDPFILREENGNLYARGASDNKGQCFYTLKALQHYYESQGNFPLNIIWLIEGEEESGSLALFTWLEKKKEALRADYLLIVDGGFLSEKHPYVSIGARGIVSMKISLEEGNKDMHSGVLGGIAYNTNRALSEILSSLHHPDNSIAIEGFYDDLALPSDSDRPDLPKSDTLRECEENLGFRPQGYEASYSPEESALRPTVEINGISGGYTGPGFKTVIPYRATAYLSCRLVPNQDPDKAAHQVIHHLKQQVPSSLKFSYEILPGGSRGWRSSANLPIVKVLQEIYSDLYNEECLRLVMPATIPIGPLLGEAAQTSPIICGTSYLSDDIHAAEEHFSMDQLKKGFLSICQLLDKLPKIKE
ncbi:hypothetical protein CpB1017 [Chlamydia pneumoniae TW-183]|uniref:Peptidase, M20/M25/M40 family n=4 Tax=Chlamydia pneumoniae TaxID=83558 RepID=Q9Z6S9_CHLPN|nr:hypothetical protein CPn_0980 [Chlamydia pneumoniae CWL029]AAF73713.1 peptidase, M20/M25/M40 family [Chlamydia pneumoniae AR39]AAP98946.1 hypothetical protein CpB1017 [Chlamydia pneumoniae TW-183]CRI33520.1 Peptidase, M20/M25/M40 family [Chlamydia pneumoniae]BAA99187.1 hypothetical protein [Chlamydia pneumoniae J138]